MTTEGSLDDPGLPGDLTLPAEVGGLLAYAPCGVGAAFSVVVAVVERKQRFLRFHAFQSLLLHVTWTVLLVVTWLAGLVVRATRPGAVVVVTLLALAFAAVWLVTTVVLMTRAYLGRAAAVPGIARWARRWA